MQGTGFEGNSCLAWSYAVLNHVLQRTLRTQKEFLVGFDDEARAAVSDTMHIMSKVQLAKNPDRVMVRFDGKWAK